MVQQRYGYANFARCTTYFAQDLQPVGVLAAAGVRVADLLDLRDASERQVEGAILKPEPSGRYTDSNGRTCELPLGRLTCSKRSR